MNYYEILEVSQKASPEVIKAAYKSLMQRYHPDRNPGNEKSAEHASKVVQAYDVLSDSTKRAAYDIQLKQPLTEHLNNIRNRSWDDIAPSDLVVKDTPSNWFLLPLIAVILLSGWYICSSAKKSQTPESELKEINLSLENNQLTPDQKLAKFKRKDEIFREHPELGKKESEPTTESVKKESERPEPVKNDANEKQKGLDARTVPEFITNLTVKLKIQDISSGDTVHEIFIPIMGAIVGTVDSESVIRHIANKNELIRQKLAEKLADAKYEDLIKFDGELYLKKMILDSIADTIGTDKIKNYPSVDEGVHGYYGVVDVLLPASYSVH